MLHKFKVALHSQNIFILYKCKCLGLSKGVPSAGSGPRLIPNACWFSELIFFWNYVLVGIKLEIRLHVRETRRPLQHVPDLVMSCIQSNCFSWSPDPMEISWSSSIMQSSLTLSIWKGEAAALIDQQIEIRAGFWINWMQWKVFFLKVRWKLNKLWFLDWFSLKKSTYNPN